MEKIKKERLQKIEDERRSLERLEPLERLELDEIKDKITEWDNIAQKIANEYIKNGCYLEVLIKYLNEISDDILIYLNYAKIFSYYFIKKYEFIRKRIISFLLDYLGFKVVNFDNLELFSIKQKILAYKECRLGDLVEIRHYFYVNEYRVSCDTKIYINGKISTIKDFETLMLVEFYY